MGFRRPWSAEPAGVDGRVGRGGYGPNGHFVHYIHFVHDVQTYNVHFVQNVHRDSSVKIRSRGRFVRTSYVTARKPSARSLWSEVLTATVDARKPSARSTVLAGISSLASLVRIGAAQNRRPRLALSFHQVPPPHRSHTPPQPTRSLRSLVPRTMLSRGLASLGTLDSARHMAVGARRRGARAAPALREGRPTERSEGGSRLGRARLRSLVD